MIPWSEHSAPITITFPPVEGAVGYKIMAGITEGMDAVRSEMRECASRHPLFVAYRRYRRGKNRCKWCGCKVEDPHD